MICGVLSRGTERHSKVWSIGSIDPWQLIIGLLLKKKKIKNQELTTMLMKLLHRTEKEGML